MVKNRISGYYTYYFGPLVLDLGAHSRITRIYICQVSFNVSVNPFLMYKFFVSARFCKICPLPIIKVRSVVLVICLCNNTNTQALSHKKMEKAVSKIRVRQTIVLNMAEKMTTIEILISKIISKASAHVYVCLWTITSTS